MSRVPEIRLRVVNGRPLNAAGRYVLHWMIAFRRTKANFALQRALETARELQRPLVVLEALNVDYPHASDRLHHFVIDGMADNARTFSTTSVTYLPYVERAPCEGKGLLESLAHDACLVTTDDYPSFFLPAIVEAAGRRVGVRMEAIDSNGLVPIRSVGKTCATARAFRSHVQKTVRTHLDAWPSAMRFTRLPRIAPSDLPLARWPIASSSELASPTTLLASLPIDHTVPRAPMVGGASAARRALDRFVADGLARYADDGRHPDLAATSRLSPYLHFGHISAHEIFSAVMTAEGWTSRKLGRPPRGARSGWWGVSANAEAYLDQLLTWRELGFNMCARRPDDYASYHSLPDWARKTLGRHSRDKRTPRYSRAILEQARTHDAVWNAAQRQLLRDGWMHNYLRMLWGKKILEWSASPEEALATMIAIMNRHAVDGRDPNSYNGYCWTLGRYDRPWGPERPIYGTVRYMSSENTLRKLKMRKFMEEYGS